MDNPFRPGSVLSREADIIVDLIKRGLPISNYQTGLVEATSANNNKPVNNAHYQKFPEKVKNGNGTHKKSKTQDGETPPGAGLASKDSKVEEVVPKKPKCKCCVIQ